MDFIITFCGSVAASMIAHYLCKWLEENLAVLDKPKLTCALNKKNPQKISHIFWGFVLLCLWHHYLCLSVS